MVISNNKCIHLSISKLPIFFIFLKFDSSFFLSNLISDNIGKFILVKHEHKAALLIISYSENSQPSSHPDNLYFIKSSLLALIGLSNPFSFFKV